MTTIQFTSMTRILHIIIGLSIGGAENSLKRLIEYHKDNPDYQHAVISLTTLGKIGEQLQAQGVEVNALGLRSLFNAPKVFWHLIKLIRQANPDIIQTWMYHADLLGGLAAWLTGKKVIWSVRNTHTSVGSGTAARTKYIMYICAYLSFYIPKKIVCVANAAIISHKGYGYNDKVMSVIPNGYDVNNIRQLAFRISRESFRNSLGIDCNAVIIGTVGRYNDYKDFPTFIKAADILSKSYSNLCFLLIGRNVDGNNKELTDLIAATGCAESFIVLGERDDIPACLSVMDIFCLHSISEGFPNVLGEAMCVGLPCVTTDVGDAALMVGKHGIVVPHSRPDLLAQGLQALIDLSPKERQQLGQELHQRIQNEYSIAKVREAYETLYQQVLAL